MREGFKLEVDHRPDCFLKDDPAPFIVLDRAKGGYDFSRRRNGARGGGTLFFRFVCNDPDCPARMLVRWDVLSKWIGRG